MPNWTDPKIKQLSRRLRGPLAAKPASRRIPVTALPNAIIEPADPVGRKPKRTSPRSPRKGTR